MISIGNYMWANVNERKQEIGIRRMIGYPKSSIYYILMLKAAIMGLTGGIIGYLSGVLIAWF
jgi:putative ABC transport system permease protein